MAKKKDMTLHEALAQIWCRALIERFAELVADGMPALVEVLDMVAKEAVQPAASAARPATTRARAVVNRRRKSSPRRRRTS